MVKHFQRVDETQHHHIDRGATIAAVNKPVICSNELGHITDKAPVTVMITTVPCTKDLHWRGRSWCGRRTGWRCRRGLCGRNHINPTKCKQRNHKTSQQDTDKLLGHSVLLM